MCKSSMITSTNICEWQVASSIYSTPTITCKTVKIACWAFAVHRPWIWIIMVWAFSTDIVYFRFASPQARKQLFCTASECRFACVCPRAINSSLVCPWFRPHVYYVCHTLDTPKSAQRLITYALNFYLFIYLFTIFYQGSPFNKSWFPIGPLG